MIYSLFCNMFCKKSFKIVDNNIMQLPKNLQDMTVLHQWTETNYSMITNRLWYNISEMYYLSEDYIEKYSDDLYWFLICRYQKLSEPFLCKWEHKLSFTEISYNDTIDWNNISEDWIDQHLKYLDIKNISKLKNFSRKFCKKNNLDDRWCN